MPAQPRAEITHEVTASIRAALDRNAALERTIVRVLLSLFCVGIGLLVYGVVADKTACLVSSGLFEIAIAFPVQRLIKLRAESVRLQVLPDLLRLAGGEDAKALAADLVRQLMKQV